MAIMQATCLFICFCILLAMVTSAMNQTGSLNLAPDIFLPRVTLHGLQNGRFSSLHVFGAFILCPVSVTTGQ